MDAAFGALPSGGQPGPYLLQAAIAACHARDAGPRTHTPWGEIAGPLRRPRGRGPGPGRASSTGRSRWRWRTGLAPGSCWWRRSTPDGGLADYHLFHATRADLLRRLGRRVEAAAAYERALSLATNEAERAFLACRLGEVRAAG